MNITFDTNVWEPVVNEEKHHLIEIKNKILDGKIQAYICEIALDLEAIQRKERAEFFGNYEPSITVEHLPPENGKFRMQFCIAPNTDLHPGIHEKQWDKLLKARDLGFRVLRMTTAGTVRTKEIPGDMYVQHDDIEEFWRYAGLLENCSDFIMGLGCGRAAKAQFNMARLVQGVRLYQTNRRKNSRKRLLSGLTVRHFRHTTQQVMISFAQTTRLGMRGLDPYFILRIGLHWKKNLVSK